MPTVIKRKGIAACEWEENLMPKKVKRRVGRRRRWGRRWGGKKGDLILKKIGRRGMAEGREWRNVGGERKSGVREGKVERGKLVTTRIGRM